MCHARGRSHLSYLKHLMVSAAGGMCQSHLRLPLLCSAFVRNAVHFFHWVFIPSESVSYGTVNAFYSVFVFSSYSWLCWAWNHFLLFHAEMQINPIWMGLSPNSKRPGHHLWPIAITPLFKVVVRACYGTYFVAINHFTSVQRVQT